MADEELPFRWGQPARFSEREIQSGGNQGDLTKLAGLPSGLYGSPAAAWSPIPGNPATNDVIVAASHLSQFRWVRITATLLVGSQVKVPLICSMASGVAGGSERAYNPNWSEHVPLIDPAFPPFVWARQSKLKTGGLPDQAYQDLQDPGENYYDTGSFIRPNRDTDECPMTFWGLRRINDPVPCWELVLNFEFMDRANPSSVGNLYLTNVNIDFLSNSVGPFPSPPGGDSGWPQVDCVSGTPASTNLYARTLNPAPGGDGRSAIQAWMMLDECYEADFGGSPDANAVNRMVYMTAGHDVPYSGGTYDLWLTTTGTSAGANIFDPWIRPVVGCFAQKRHAGFGAGELKATGARNSWALSTRGMMSHWPHSVNWTDPYTIDGEQTVKWAPASGPPYADNYAPPNFAYNDVLQYDSVSGKWRVRIYLGDGRTTAGIWNDRSVYVCAFGRAP